MPSCNYQTTARLIKNANEILLYKLETSSATIILIPLMKKIQTYYMRLTSCLQLELCSHTLIVYEILYR